MKKKNYRTDEDTSVEVELPKKKGKISKQTRNYIIYGILIAAVTALTLYFLLKEDPKAVIDTISNAKIWPLLCIFGLVLLVTVIIGIVLTIITKIYNKKYRVHHGIINGLIGSFFSNVTPFASGGQFVQVYTFTRQGVKGTNAASILVMHFIVYQTVLLLYGFVAFFAGFDVISKMGAANIFGFKLPPITLSIIGFAINSFTIVSLFFLAFCRPLHRFILNSGVNFLAKLHIVKNPEEKRISLMKQVASFRIEFKRLIVNFKVLIPIFILLIIKMTILYSVPYFAGLATNVDMSGKYLDSLWSSSYLAMITSFIPIPGGSGGAEWGFQTLFLPIYGDAQITAACNILWRGISYYLITLVGGLVFAFYRGKPKVKTEKVADTQTFLELDLSPFIHKARKNTLDMLDRKYEKMDDIMDKNLAAEMLSREEVLDSFNKMKDEINFDELVTTEENKADEISKRYLKIAIDDTERIVNDSRDEEVEKAYQEDIADFNRRVKIKKFKIKKSDKEEK